MIRPAVPADVPTIASLIRALAEYEKLAHEVVLDEARLQEHLFGPRPFAEVLIAEVEDRSVGFALFFHNYSTFLGRPGIYLEDLFVLPEYRGHGLGKAWTGTSRRSAFMNRSARSRKRNGSSTARPVNRWRNWRKRTDDRS